MKKIFNIKVFQIIGSITFFSISFILCHFTHLATFHGKSDAPIIVAILGVITLLVSYIFNLKTLTLTATLGYIISFFIGVLLDTEGIVTGDGMIHDLWIVWITSYWVFNGIGIVCDFVKKIKQRKLQNTSNNILQYIGLFVGVFILGGSIFTYLTKPLTMNDVMQHKPRLFGTVLEIYDNNSMLVQVNSNENISSDKIIVPLDVIMTDVSVSKDDFNIGDIVKVYYDGTMDDKQPAQVNDVYAIFEERISKENPNE
ncbi:MAG TPA: hypothetical protein DD421_09375 [Clostridiaceae bacterium]|nr:hypothetical protein [Clostridiaceae bacterium]